MSIPFAQKMYIIVNFLHKIYNILTFLTPKMRFLSRKTNLTILKYNFNIHKTDFAFIKCNMGIKIKRKNEVFLGIGAIFVMIMLATNPSEYMQSCLNGISIWGISVLPALFPFFFFSGILTKLQFLDVLGNKLSKIMQKTFHTSGSSGIIYLISIISGYPVGAKITSDLYQKGVFSRDEVVRINAFASTSGPLFVIGAVGVGMLCNHTLGVILLISHLLGALANGLLYRNYHYSRESCINIQNSQGVNESISSTLYDSIISILVVGGYIVIANILIDMLTNLGVLSVLGGFIDTFASFLGCSANIGTGISNGILEITRGCKDLSLVSLSPQILVPLMCGLISWGGLSIQLQALTFLQKCGISARFYMLQKFTQAIISALICWIFCIIFV